jgi:hypothetical protein
LQFVILLRLVVEVVVRFCEYSIHNDSANHLSSTTSTLQPSMTTEPFNSLLLSNLTHPATTSTLQPSMTTEPFNSLLLSNVTHPATTSTLQPSMTTELFNSLLLSNVTHPATAKCSETMRSLLTYLGLLESTTAFNNLCDIVLLAVLFLHRYKVFVSKSLLYS